MAWDALGSMGQKTWLKGERSGGGTRLIIQMSNGFDRIWVSSAHTMFNLLDIF